MAQTQTMPALSGNDACVLNALFDAESSLSRAPQIATSIRRLPQVSESELDVLQAEELRVVKPLATSNPTPEAIKIAIQDLGDLIHREPKYASAYVNRAQAQRMLLGDQPLTESEREVVSAIIDDLSKAIAFAKPTGSDMAVSALQAKVLSEAHTHRAHLYYHIAKSGDLSSLPEKYRELGPQRLEELASSEFSMGGTYGNPVARQMSVRTNPYAKMCGAIVREALQKEMEGQ